MKTSELVNLPITSSDEDENKVLTSSPISSLTSPSTSPLISRPISSSTNLIMRNSLDEEETQFTMDPILSKKKQSVEFQENVSSIPIKKIIIIFLGYFFFNTSTFS